jgi:hypothetical protein
MRTEEFLHNIHRAIFNGGNQLGALGEDNTTKTNPP